VVSVTDPYGRSLGFLDRQYAPSDIRIIGWTYGKHGRRQKLIPLVWKYDIKMYLKESK
jgi:hypothetical protein